MTLTIRNYKGQVIDVHQREREAFRRGVLRGQHDKRGGYIIRLRCPANGPESRFPSCWVTFGSTSARRKFPSGTSKRSVTNTKTGIKVPSSNLRPIRRGNDESS